MSTAPKEPRATPAAVLGAVAIAVALIALGVAGLQWLAADQGWIGGTPLIDRIVDSVDGRRVADWGLIAGLPAVLIGLWLVFVAVKPRRRTHEPVPGDVDAWITRGALAALATSAAEEVSGVVEATSSLNRRSTLTVRAVTEPDLPQDDVLAAVGERVRSRVDELTSRTVEVRPAKARR